MLKSLSADKSLLKCPQNHEYLFHLLNLDDADLETEIREKIKITYVGHSMGGMTLPMYLIHSKLRNKNHHLSQAILISPAGIHTQGRVSLYLDFIGNFFYRILPLFTDHVALPDCMVAFLQKLQQDTLAMPAVNDLLQYLASKIIGGQASSQNGSFLQSAKIVQSILFHGFSAGVPAQIYQQYQFQQFQAYDYGSKDKNL